jgi:C4-dicarboxylate transporter DctQ subunit
MRRILLLINKIEEWTLVLVLLMMAFLTAIQVFCRYLIGFSFTWMEELNRYVGVFITFLSAALGVKYGVHFSMDLFYERISHHGLRHGVKVIVDIICGILLVVVAWYGWEQTMKLRQFGALTATLQVPKYVFYLPVPLFSLVMAFRFFNLSVRHLASLVRGEPYRVIDLK